MHKYVKWYWSDMTLDNSKNVQIENKERMVYLADLWLDTYKMMIKVEFYDKENGTLIFSRERSCQSCLFCRDLT